MKTLYLVRHAKSSWEFSDLSDFERPLNNRGKNDAPVVGKFLKSQQILPDLMLSSPAVRALHTATIIAREIGYHQNIQVNEKMYHAHTPELWHIVKSVPDKVNELMIFGHNPSFTEFANEMVTQVIDNLPTCGVFAVNWHIKSWNDIKKGEGKFKFFEFPKNLK